MESAPKMTWETGGNWLSKTTSGKSTTRIPARASRVAVVRPSLPGRPSEQYTSEMRRRAWRMAETAVEL